MSSTVDEILNNNDAVASETSAEATVANSRPPLKVLTFNGPERQHQKFLWWFVPLVLLLVVVI